MAILLLLLSAGAGARAADKRPNVILISLDAMAADHMELYGYPRATMPALRELAHESVNFEKAYAQAAFTLPSHYSMFTGTNPYSHRVIDMSVPPSHANTPAQVLDPKIRTLTEYLKRAGYATYGSAQLWGSQLNLTRGLDRGFDLLTLPLLDRIFDPEDKEALFRLLHAAAARSPAFLFFYAWGGHDPYRPAPPDDVLFGRKKKKKPIQTEDEVYRMLADLRGKGKKADGNADPERDAYFAQFNLKKKSDVEHLTDLYDGGLHSLDRKLKTLFAMLKEAGLYDNSIIIVTADHGESLGDHGLFRHSTPYENEIHVPLLLRAPGVAAAEVPEPVRSIDILPTVLDLLHLEGDPAIEGKSLLPRIRGGSAPAPEFYSLGLVSEALREGPWKLITWGGRRELYRVDEDPLEKHDLSAKNPAKAAELEAKLEAIKAARAGKP